MTNKEIKKKFQEKVDEGKARLQVFIEDIRRYEAMSRDTNKYGPQAREEYRQKVIELKHDYNAVLVEVKHDIGLFFDEQIAEMQQRFSLDPKELNADAELLKGFSLTANDLRAIKARNKENKTMIRLISNYAMHNGLSDRDAGLNTDLIDTQYREEKETVDGLDRIKSHCQSYLWRYADDERYFQNMRDTITGNLDDCLPD